MEANQPHIFYTEGTQHIRGTTLLHNRISSYQYAFYKNRSAEAAIHCVVNIIETAFQCIQFALGESVDIVVTSDNTCYDIKRRALARFESYFVDLI